MNPEEIVLTIRFKLTQDHPMYKILLDEMQKGEIIRAWSFDDVFDQRNSIQKSLDNIAYQISNMKEILY